MQDWINALSGYSATRERVLEHRFLAEICGELWSRAIFDFAVSRSEVDNSGYDVIVEACGVQRHIQLKAMHNAAKRRAFDVQTRLADKDDGCVVLMIHHPQSLQIESYRWFGRLPGLGLPALGEKVTRHSKGDSTGYKAERLALREASLAKFDQLATVSELVDKLFGSVENAD